MGKRFTSTEKWTDPWFRKLPPLYKLFWFYLCENCNNAGIWNVDLELAGILIGEPLDPIKIDELFGKRIQKISDQYWFLESFIKFQYGTLSPDSRPHQQVLLLLAAHSIIGYPKGIQGVSNTPKDKDKDKDYVDVKGKVLERGADKFNFDLVWSRYPRKLGRTGAAKHFAAQIKTTQDWEDLQKALNNYMNKLRADGTEEKFIQHGSTWFSGHWKDWINYSGGKNGADERKSFSVYADIAAQAREAKRASGLRKVSESPDGALSAWVRDRTLGDSQHADPETGESIRE